MTASKYSPKVGTMNAQIRPTEIDKPCPFAVGINKQPPSVYFTRNEDINTGKYMPIDGKYTKSYSHRAQRIRCRKIRTVIIDQGKKSLIKGYLELANNQNEESLGKMQPRSGYARLV